MKWSYGVTTVPTRRESLLPRTLASLKAAGFPAPRLFVDGCQDTESWRDEFALEVTGRWPVIRTFGNWVLALVELYVREPEAHRYAIFQDDFVTYANLRAYLEWSPYPDRGYLNLYTFASNQAVCPRGKDGKPAEGWFKSNQMGRGAVALVFDRDAVVALLSRHESALHMALRPQDPHRGHRAVDGGVVTAMKKIGYTEWVHNPSLTQHTGKISAMGNKPHQDAPAWRGEGFDARELVPR